jgi:hypothetical protein
MTNTGAFAAGSGAAETGVRAHPSPAVRSAAATARDEETTVRGNRDMSE